MLRLKLIHVSKRGPSCFVVILYQSTVPMSFRIIPHALGQFHKCLSAREATWRMLTLVLRTIINFMWYYCFYFQFCGLVMWFIGINIFWFDSWINFLFLIEVGLIIPFVTDFFFDTDVPTVQYLLVWENPRIFTNIYQFQVGYCYTYLGFGASKIFICLTHKIWDTLNNIA